MKGDFTRFTHDASKRYVRVLMQQGRVQMDADWNEQTAIEYAIGQQTRLDTIGASGVPQAADMVVMPNDFRVTADDASLLVNGGTIYVHGHMVHDEPGPYRVLSTTGSTIPIQPSYPPQLDLLTADGTFLVYLDVWFRHVTWLDDPNIREVALNGPDHGSRLKLVWQVRLMPISLAMGEDNPCGVRFADYDALTRSDTSVGQLAAWVDPALPVTDACDIPANAGYRGAENQLYRVEIHQGGAPGVATFKWSRENGAVTASLLSWDDTKKEAVVSSGGPDTVLGFAANDWVEVYDDATVLANPLPGDPDRNYLGALLRVSKVEGDTLTLDTSSARGGTNAAAIASGTSLSDLYEISKNAQVRRWDGETVDAVIPVVIGTPIELENHIMVQFSGTDFHAGDYWLIPARFVTHDVEWPLDSGGAPAGLAPEGSAHHYTRLAVATRTGGTWTVNSDCRKPFLDLVTLTARETLLYLGGDGQEFAPGAAPDSNLTPFRVGVFRGTVPVPGRTVSFNATLGGSDVHLASATGTIDVVTNADGVAEVIARVSSWELERIVVTATMEGTTTPAIQFSARRQVALALESGDDQAGVPGSPLPSPIVFRVTHHTTIQVGDATVRLDVVGGGTLTVDGVPSTDASQSHTTKSDGTIAVAWRLGSDPLQAQRIRANLMAGTIVLQSVEVLANNCVTTTILQGDAQHVYPTSKAWQRVEEEVEVSLKICQHPGATAGCFVRFESVDGTRLRFADTTSVSAPPLGSESHNLAVTSSGVASRAIWVNNPIPSSPLTVWFLVQGLTPDGDRVGEQFRLHVDLVPRAAASPGIRVGAPVVSDGGVFTLDVVRDGIVAARALTGGLRVTLAEGAVAPDPGGPRVEVFLEVPSDVLFSRETRGHQLIRVPSVDAAFINPPTADQQLTWDPSAAVGESLEDGLPELREVLLKLSGATTDHVVARVRVGADSQSETGTQELSFRIALSAEPIPEVVLLPNSNPIVMKVQDSNTPPQAFLTKAIAVVGAQNTGTVSYDPDIASYRYTPAGQNAVHLRWSAKRGVYVAVAMQRLFHIEGLPRLGR